MGADYKYEHDVNEESEVTLTIDIPGELFKTRKEKALKRLSPRVDLKGFRPGKAPKHLIEARLGASLYEETLNELLPSVTAEVISELKLDPITQVEYRVEKVGEDEGVKYKAVFTKYPEIKLADFSKIDVKKDDVEVKPDEVEKVIENMLNDKAKSKSAKDEPKGEKTKQKRQEATDEWVASLQMENIKTVDALKEEIEKTIKRQKEAMAEDKYSYELVKKAYELSNIKVPKKLLEIEVAAMEKNYTQRIENLGLNINDFLRNQKTSIEELRKEWEKEAEEKLKQELLVVQIIKDKDIKVTGEDIENELKNITDARLKEQYNNSQGRSYIQNVMARQKALAWLKDQTQKKDKS